MKLIQLEPLPYVNTDEAHILIPSSMLTAYNDLTNQVKDKSTEYFGRCRSARALILQEKVGVKKSTFLQIFES